MRVLFTTVAQPGHFFPLVPLAWACRSVGHDVMVLSTEEFVPTMALSGLPVASSGPGEPYAILRADDTPRAGLVGQRAAHGHIFGRMAAKGLGGTTDVVRFWRPDVIVSERAEFAGPLAAFSHGIPQVELHWGVAALPEYRAGAASQLRQQLNGLGIDELPAPAMMLNPWPPRLRHPHAIHHQGIRSSPHYNGSAVVPEWTLRPRLGRRVCLTLGTVVPRFGQSRAADSMIEIITELAQLDVEVVVAVDESVAAGWPPLPATVRHIGRLPLAQVLSCSDAAVHHGGQGTTLTALEAGLPQLMLPVFDDQFDNAASVANVGAGIYLRPGSFSPREVAYHCAQLLATPRYRRAALAVAGEIDAQPSPADVARLLPDLARHHRGGTGTPSAA